MSWQHRATQATGQLAICLYLLEAGRDQYATAAVDVLALDGELIAAIHAYLTTDLLRELGHDGQFAPADFAAFGLPPELPARGSALG